MSWKPSWFPEISTFNNYHFSFASCAVYWAASTSGALTLPLPLHPHLPSRAQAFRFQADQGNRFHFVIAPFCHAHAFPVLSLSLSLSLCMPLLQQPVRPRSWADLDDAAPPACHSLPLQSTHRYPSGVRRLASGVRQTPKLDTFVKSEAAILTDYYVYRFCSPSRSTFMTGR